jgi:hypothetical protein
VAITAYFGMELLAELMNFKENEPSQWAPECDSKFVTPLQKGRSSRSLIPRKKILLYITVSKRTGHGAFFVCE